MAKVYLISENDPDGKYAFKCPGCNRTHHIPTKGPQAWGFNNSADKPTFTPSLLSYYEGPGGEKAKVCHSFITDGKIQFLGDCYHDLKNQTIDLPEIKNGESH